MPVKGHPALDPAHAGTSQARLRQELGPGMERRNLEEVEHARQWLSANQRRQGTVNQYARNSLRQMTVALLEGFPHVSFTRTCIVLRTSLAEPFGIVPVMHAPVDFD